MLESSRQHSPFKVHSTKYSAKDTELATPLGPAFATDKTFNVNLFTLLFLGKLLLLNSFHIPLADLQ